MKNTIFEIETGSYSVDSEQPYYYIDSAVFMPTNLMPTFTNGNAPHSSKDVQLKYI